MMDRPFKNRTEAGQQLAREVGRYLEEHGLEDESLLVLALPRGGVPVAFEVAKSLEAPLDVFLVRKLGLPGHEELAMGAIASGGLRVLNKEVLAYCAGGEEDIERVAEREHRELKRRESAYRGDRPPPEIAGRVVFLVDDGIATGSTMAAAARAIRAQRPVQLVVAVPVAPPDSVEKMRGEADDVLVVMTPHQFSAIGQWYEDFSQNTDEEVRTLLEEARRFASAASS